LCLLVHEEAKRNVPLKKKALANFCTAWI